MTLDELAQRFRGPAKRHATGVYVYCPTHDDVRKPSLSLRTAENGALLVKCFAGCATEAVLAAVHPSFRDLAASNGNGPNRRNGHARGDGPSSRRIVATYDYVDGAGQLRYQVVRYEPKHFLPRRPDGAGGWTWNLEGVERVLYRLPDLAEQPRVFLAEGEKDADRLAALGVIATTTPGGAAAWRDAYAEQLANLGVREVIVLPDNDAPGARYAACVARACLAQQLVARIVRLPGLGPKQDVSDWLDAGHPLAELEALVAAQAPVDPATHADGPILVRLADVEAEAVEYLWPPRVPLGKLTLVVGDPGHGKTYLTSGDIAARVTRGAAWPDGGDAPEGDVIILTSEDGMADTLRPRLDRQGGNPARVHVLRGVRVEGLERAFSFERDLAMLETAFASTRARVGIIDPLSAYLGARDSYKDSEIRGILSPLAQLAERLRVAIIGVLHLTKDQQRRLVMRVQGNIAFVAQARSVLAVGADPDRPARRLLVHIKNNLGPMAPTLAFRITDDGLTWEAAPVDGMPEHLLAGDPVATRAERSELDEAATFLRTILATHPVPSRQIEKDAKANGIAQRTLWRAKAALQIKAEQMPTGAGGYAWYWALPPAGGAA